MCGTCEKYGRLQPTCSYLLRTFALQITIQVLTQCILSPSENLVAGHCWALRLIKFNEKLNISDFTNFAKKYIKQIRQGACGRMIASAHSNCIEKTSHV